MGYPVDYILWMDLLKLCDSCVILFHRYLFVPSQILVLPKIGTVSFPRVTLQCGFLMLFLSFDRQFFFYKNIKANL